MYIYEHIHPCAYFRNHEFTPIWPIPIHPHRVLFAFSHLLIPITHLKECQHCFSILLYVSHFKSDEILSQCFPKELHSWLICQQSITYPCQNRSLAKDVGLSCLAYTNHPPHHLHPWDWVRASSQVHDHMEVGEILEENRVSNRKKEWELQSTDIREATSCICYINLQPIEWVGQHKSSEIVCKIFFVCAHA